MLQVSVAAFFIKWQDVQVQTQIYVSEGCYCSFAGIPSGADASSRGLELQSRPLAALQVDSVPATPAHASIPAAMLSGYGAVLT